MHVGVHVLFRDFGIEMTRMVICMSNTLNTCVHVVIKDNSSGLILLLLHVFTKKFG